MILDAELQQSLAQEIAAYLRRIPDVEVRPVYARVLAAVESGQITEDCLEPIGHVLSISIETGRMRKLYGPHVEAQAQRLFEQTPQGRQLQNLLAQVNQALSALTGQAIREITVALKGPGAFYLTVRTELCRIRLLFDRSGVHPVEVETASSI